MLNHTYTSVNNANLVDCGKKQHISSQPSPILKNNFLGEFRTELDKKKVLANLGIATDLVLEWENIKGDIGKNEALIKELDARTKYISALDGISKTLAEGIAYLETIVGGEQDAESIQNDRLQVLETAKQSIETEISTIKNYLSGTIDVSIASLKNSVQTIDEQLANINSLIKVSEKEGNALELLEGETSGLYVPDLSGRLQTAEESMLGLQESVSTIQDSLDTFVTKEQLGGNGDFNFVDQNSFDSFSSAVDQRLDNFDKELGRTVKTGEDGHVDTLFVNKISKDNTEGNIEVTDSFEVTTNKPLDVRFVKDTISDLLSIPVSVCYEGMGVIVNSLSSLYILKSTEGSLTQEYVSDIKNWKCPEDLVTVAMTRAEYEALEEINPNVFYYIYEDEIKLTQEPKREEFTTDEAFQEAWQVWTDSLKVLSQEYMSASWGVDIENKLAKKASEQSVTLLSQEIQKLKGGEGELSLESLTKEIESLKDLDTVIEQRLDEILNTVDETEVGRLVTVETQVASVNENLKAYVTKDELAELSGDFNFVKPEDYEADKKAFNDALAENLTTKKITINGSVVDVQEGILQVNSEAIAKKSEVPNIEVLPQADYDKLETVDENTYYYTYDENVAYVTQTELKQKLEYMQEQINTLSKTISTLEKTIEDLQALHSQEEENI